MTPLQCNAGSEWNTEIWISGTLRGGLPAGEILAGSEKCGTKPIARNSNYNYRLGGIGGPCPWGSRGEPTYPWSRGFARQDLFTDAVTDPSAFPENVELPLYVDP